MTRHSAAIVALLVSLAAAACTSTNSPSSPNRLTAVATTTVFADMVANVAVPGVEVVSLVPKGGEVHTFDPKPSDIARLAGANVIVKNGLGLDDWVDRFVGSAAPGVPVLTLGNAVPAGHDLTGDDGRPNPHLWMDVANARLYVTAVRDALIAADPADAATFQANAAAYDSALGKLDDAIRAALTVIPESQRSIVVYHDAFPYFARAYGLKVIGTVIPAPGQDPSAADIQRLVDAVKADHVRAIFAEAQFSPKLVQELASEAGTSVVSDLYDDTLGNPPVDSYVGMMRWDADKVASALQ